MSEDGACGITVIAFIGSVFSPYYARARRNGNTEPLNHCAINVALYTPNGGRWSMTERKAANVHVAPTTLSVGPSSLRWTGEHLEVLIDEICMPLPRRIRGCIRLHPASMHEQRFQLDVAGRHEWAPIAPCARIEVQLDDPALKWSGLGYLDSNSGTAPLEDGFDHWSWSRSESSQRTLVFYDVYGRDARPDPLALSFTGESIEEIEPPARRPLPTTAWGIRRETRADDVGQAHVLKTLENAPFYSRSLLSSQVHGVRSRVIHETVDLMRFRRRWVQGLLPFRMPRIFF